MKMLRLVPFALVLACGVEQDAKLPMATPIDACLGLAPLTLIAHPPMVRLHEPVTLSASGGTGRYTFTLQPGGSGGTLHADRLVAGPTPGTDHVTVSDDCMAMASVDVAVRADFVVQPTRATVRPGTSFALRADGMLGTASFRPQTLASGGSIGADGVYVAGPTDGLDLIAVRDDGSGEELLVQIEVRADAMFRASPAVLALPTGGAVTLTTRDGTDVLTWTKRSGPGALTDRKLTIGADERGVAIFDAEDAFTHERTSVEVHVLEELTRVDRPHGRLTDVASLVTGDFDGDGREDVALGVPESDLGRPSGGAIFVFRGSAQGLPTAPTWTITGDSDTGSLGAVLVAGDLDGDGKDDLAASAPGADVTVADSGAVLLYKFNADGPLLLRPALTGLGRGNFGASLAIEDLDGDGVRDLIIGSPGADLAPSSSMANRGVLDLFLLQAGGTIPDLGTMRLGGSDLAVDGTTKATRDIRFGRAVTVADFNGDGRNDIASLGSVNNTLLGGVPVAKNQVAVAIHFGRAGTPAFFDTPDLVLLPANLSDGGEGTWRMRSGPAVGASRAARLILSADQMDSPDLSNQGGVKSGGNAGGVLVFDLSAQAAPDAAPAQPVQIGRSDAFAKIWGDESNIQAGRSTTIFDIDGDGKLELVLGAPYASYNPNPKDGSMNLRQTGKVLVYPYEQLAAGSEVNKPTDSRPGSNKSDTLGVAVTGYRADEHSDPAVIALAARATTDIGDFTGRMDVFFGKGALATLSVSSAALPARLAAQQTGVAVEVGVVDKQLRSLVAMPGWSGPGSGGDGNDVGAGRALAYTLGAGSMPHVVAEGAGTSYVDNGQAAYGGRGIANDIALTDFDGDGRLDYVVAAPQLPTPTMTTTDYASVQAACVTAQAQGNGGALVFLARPDGSYREGFRLFAMSVIDGCTPTDNASCKRTSLARAGIAGGFDFDGDGKQDVAVTRNNGIDIFLGRAPEDPSLAKPSMVCDSAFTLPALPTQTSAPVALGDLDADGCAEVGVRYDGTHTGYLVVFGVSGDGKRCKARKDAAWLRISGDSETGLDNMQLGIASGRAGKLLGDARDFIAVSAGSYPFAGVSQPTVLLFDAAELIAKRPVRGELLVSALDDGLAPLALAYPQRLVGFGRSLVGNVDLDGDAQVDLLVSAPSASIEGDGTGAVFGFRGGPLLAEGFATSMSLPVDPWLMILGDTSERGAVGQSLSAVAKTSDTPATIAIGAPTSFRTGTSNGTAWLCSL